MTPVPLMSMVPGLGTVPAPAVAKCEELLATCAIACCAAASTALRFCSLVLTFKSALPRLIDDSLQTDRGGNYGAGAVGVDGARIGHGARCCGGEVRRSACHGRRGH